MFCLNSLFNGSNLIQSSRSREQPGQYFLLEWKELLLARLPEFLGLGTKAPGGTSPALEFGTARLQFNHLHITAQGKEICWWLWELEGKRDFLFLFFVMEKKKIRKEQMKIKGGSPQEKDVLPLKSGKTTE